MNAPLILPLGEKLSQNTSIGNKARLLDVASAKRLPVPKGVIVTDECYQQALHERAIEVKKGKVTCANPYHLLAVVRVPAFRNSVAVRSAFSAEDKEAESLAGFFESRLFVARENPEAFVEALCAVWSSALRREGKFRRDVLVMEMIEATHSGVAFTETDYEDDLVNFTTGTAEQLVSGKVEGETLLMPKLNWYETAIENEPLPAWATRLQNLLKHIRRTFGGKNWDIEWADDGKTCWLIQLRPITKPTRRNDAFTIANHKEILPELPSRLMTSIVASCSKNLFKYYRKFDPTLPEHRLFIEIFIGRPFINLSLMTDMMRHWGLPTTLVTSNIGGDAGKIFGLNWKRVLFNLPVLFKQGLAQLQSPASAERAIQAIQQESQKNPTSFSQAIQAMQSHYTRLVTEMFSLTAAMSFPLVALRKFGTLEEHNARQETISTKMFSDLDPLRRIALKNQAVRDALQNHQLPSDKEFQSAFEAYLNKHGHRGIYESDISRPRFVEEPSRLFPAILQPFQERKLPKRTVVGLLTLPIWWQASRAIEARERLRYEAMKAFQKSRNDFLRLANEAVQKGLLPAPERIWDLTIEEALQLDDAKRYDDAFFASRQAEIEKLQSISSPDFFYRYDDLEKKSEDEFGAVRLKGISLTSGEVAGTAWILREPETRLPNGFEKSNTILVARSVDAGWIPTFALVSGVVVETGGDLSHGSIILREIGLPAITNVRGATKHIQTGQRLKLNAAQGVVECEI
ncbi:MAG: PEP/pyruvate-binding domain-containing protein [Chloroherpetonaceae bacterium]